MRTESDGIDETMFAVLWGSVIVIALSHIVYPLHLVGMFWLFAGQEFAAIISYTIYRYSKYRDAIDRECVLMLITAPVLHAITFLYRLSGSYLQ